MNRRAFKNASWIIGCKIAQSVINLIIGMISARYLGPGNYGLINYASSVVAFVVPVMQLGFTKTIIQELIDRPEREGQVLGTAYVFNIISAIACMGLVFTFLKVSNPDEPQTIAVGVLYSISLLFQATEIITYWFQSKLLSKYPSIVSFAAYIAVAVYKVYLLVTGKSVEWFAVSNSIDYALISIALLVIYHKLSNQILSFSWQLGLKMFNRSRYYIVSAMMVTIFAQTDKIMLKLMLDETQTGYYTAATVCACVTGFVFTAIIDSMRPVILESKKLDNDKFDSGMIGLYSVITYLSLAQSLVMTVLAKPIVLFLYGSQYAASIPALRIVVWYSTFSYYGAVRNVWILAEGKQKCLPLINLLGASANVVMNYFLIPVWGVVGAAIASLITQFFTNVVVGFILKPIRYNNTLMIKGINPRPIILFFKGCITRLVSKKSDE